MPTPPGGTRHKEQSSLVESGKVILHVLAPDVFKELHTPEGVESRGRPIGPPTEVVLYYRIRGQQRLLDRVMRAFQAEDSRTFLSEVVCAYSFSAAYVHL